MLTLYNRNTSPERVKGSLLSQQHSPASGPGHPWGDALDGHCSHVTALTPGIITSITRHTVVTFNIYLLKLFIYFSLWLPLYHAGSFLVAPEHLGFIAAADGLLICLNAWVLVLNQNSTTSPVLQGIQRASKEVPLVTFLFLMNNYGI